MKIAIALIVYYVFLTFLFFAPGMSRVVVF